MTRKMIGVSEKIHYKLWHILMDRELYDEKMVDELQKKHDLKVKNYKRSIGSMIDDLMLLFDYHRKNSKTNIFEFIDNLKNK